MTIKTFPLNGPINLDVRVAHGSVHVDAREDVTEAVVEAHARDGSGRLIDELTVELRGPTLTVQLPRQGGIFDLFGAKARSLLGAGGLDLRIVVPSGTAAKIHTFTAPIHVDGTVSGADLAFGHGDAQLAEVTGDLLARFGDGSVRAARVGGNVRVRSGAGDVAIDEVGGDVQSGTGSGDLGIGVAHGKVVSKCGSGTARLGEVHGDVSVTSGSGVLAVGLPAGISARLDVQTGSGTVVSELPVEDDPAASNSTITLRARTAHGDVRLFRAGAEAGPVTAA